MAIDGKKLERETKMNPAKARRASLPATLAGFFCLLSYTSSVIQAQIEFIQLPRRQGTC